MRRNVLRLAGNLCLLTAALGLTVPVTAGTATATTATAATTAEPTRTVRAAAALPQFRSMSVPVEGDFARPSPSEAVHIKGTVDVTVITLPNAAGGGTAQIISSLSNTTATGLTSNGKYYLVGAQRINAPFSAAGTTTLNVKPTFVLVPPTGAPSRVQPITVTVVVTSTGVINSIAAAVG
ncbi:hypothetical protein ACFWPQ_19230 [Streptomyces sp. NPDC058464]|uniref:hypothetical protein n=1 Tax=Streptomyces sp. NPDC058464 TaxID=3346511 RepID=UPI003667FFE6